MVGALREAQGVAGPAQALDRSRVGVSALMVGLAGNSAASERLGGPGVLRPDRPIPERAQSGRRAAIVASATADLALPRLERGTHFSIHQLLAEAPELGRTAPSRPRTLAAYRAQLAHRIHYSGLIAPVDLRV